jgi:hypothetical protein
VSTPDRVDLSLDRATAAAVLRACFRSCATSPTMREQLDGVCRRLADFLNARRVEFAVEKVDEEASP